MADRVHRRPFERDLVVVQVYPQHDYQHEYHEHRHVFVGFLSLLLQSGFSLFLTAPLFVLRVFLLWLFGFAKAKIVLILSRRKILLAFFALFFFLTFLIVIIVLEKCCVISKLIFIFLVVFLSELFSFMSSPFVHPFLLGLSSRKIIAAPPELTIEVRIKLV